MKKTEKEKTLKAFLWSGIGLWGYRILSFVVVAILSRLLPVEAFGLVAMSMTYVAFLQIFIEQGFAEAIVQKADLNDEILSTAFWTNIVISGLLFGLSFGAAPLVAKLFREPGLIPVVRGLSLLFFTIGPISVAKALLRRELEFRSLAQASVVGMVFGSVGGIAAALGGLGVWALVIFHIANRLGEMTMIWMSTNWHPHAQFSLTTLCELLSFGSKITGSRFLNFINRYGADFVIGLYLGPESLGYYELAFRLTRTLVELIGSVVSQVAFPAFSRQQSDPVIGRQFFYQMIQQLSLLSFPLFAGMAALSEEIIIVVFGAKWLPAVPTMRILILIGILHSLYYVNSSVILGYGKPSWRMLLDALNAATNLLAFFIVARWGIVAVAVAYVIRGYVTAPLPLLAVKRLIGFQFSEYFKCMIPALAGSGLMFIVVYVMHMMLKNHLGVPILTVCLISVGALVYFVVILLISPQSLKRTWGYARKALGL